MTTDMHHSKSHKYVTNQVNEEKNEVFQFWWPNYTEDDIEEWITYTGCVWPDRACEVCRNSQCCTLLKLLMGEW
jgi:hypothetical protein